MKNIINIKQKVTGAEAVILSLLDAKQQMCLSYPGGAIMPVYDALMIIQRSIKSLFGLS